MARAIPALAALVAALLASQAGAVDWRLGGQITERLSLSTNLGLEEDPDGTAFGSRTRLSLSLGARSGRYSWRLGTGFSYNYFSGQDDDNDALNGLFPNFNGSMSVTTGRLTITNTASFVQRSTAFTDFVELLVEDPEEAEDPGVPDDPFPDAPDAGSETEFTRVSRETSRITASLGTSISAQLSPLDSVGVSIRGSMRRYADDVPGLSTSDSISTSLNWSRAISRISSAGVAVSLSRYETEETVGTDTTTGLNLDARLTYRTRLTAGIGLSGSAGVSVSQIDEEETLRDGRVVETSDSDVGFSGSLSTSARLSGGRRASFSVSQRVRPDTDGNIRNVAALRASFNTPLTRWAELGLIGGYTVSSDIDFGGDLRHRFRFGPSISYTLTENWRASVNYNFSGVNDEQGFDVDNSIGLSLSRGFDILR